MKRIIYYLIYTAMKTNRLNIVITICNSKPLIFHSASIKELTLFLSACVNKKI
jgi:hypothetical protein